MEIILMRHGKPAFNGAATLPASDMADWIAQYDLAGIGDDIPPEAGGELARRARITVSSPLPRALASLKALGREPRLIDEVFSEAALPVYPLPGVRLSPANWAVLFRVMWLCGLSRNVESLTMAKRRARQAAGTLINMANEDDGPVLLMGHGIMNRLIGRELMAQGWTTRSRHGHAYWSAGIYQLG
ncbi:histidine phosphatase family protein [Siccibacter turicensis]|uniref:histidine phosphatase family protein n=1 Tax=Siccibacter turicensis TaxID=357233 RepID=UPI003F55036B